jgi:hypothetical protein
LITEPTVDRVFPVMGAINVTSLAGSAKALNASFVVDAGRVWCYICFCSINRKKIWQNHKKKTTLPFFYCCLRSMHENQDERC